MRDAIDDYVGRIKHYAKYDEVELKDGDEAEVTARFQKSIPERSKVVALEVDGQAWTTERFARFVGDAEVHSVQTLVFLIGGSYGLPASISKRADVRLSLSAMTLPHRLARLVLVEQVYRAFTLLRGEPYSH